MGLEEQIKKEEEELKKLEEAEKKDGEEEQEDETEEEEEGSDEEQEDADAEKTDKDESDDTDEDGDDEDKDAKDEADKEEAKNKNDVAAKARIERKKRLKIEEENAELRRRLVEGRQAQDAHDKDTNKEPPKKETEAEKIARLEAAEDERQAEKLRAQAGEELSAIEQEFMQDTPDYQDAATHMIRAMFQATLHMNPGITDRQAGTLVQNKILEIASVAARKGQNPAEVLYQMSFDSYGFDPAAAKKTPPGKQGKNAAEALKKKVANKKRSANGLAGGGQTAGARVTIEEADKMSLADFGSMSEAEIDELIEQAAS